MRFTDQVAIITAAASGIGRTAAKGGIIAFTREIAFELRPWGIIVNAIAPSPS